MSRLSALRRIFARSVDLPSLPRRFLAETRSDTAVEFAMIGSAFFLFVFAIFVVSVDQFWQMTLDEAVRVAARQVQIGKITSGSQLITAVCNDFGLAAPYCTGTLLYEVQQGTYFGQITPSPLSNAGMTPHGDFPALVGSSSTTSPLPEFMLVQVAYPLPFKIFIVPGGVATENGTSYLYSAVATNEEPGA